MTLKEAVYITYTGYGPCSQFTLEEWLHARELFRKNEKAALRQLNLPKNIQI
jgi:hypothetical protein